MKRKGYSLIEVIVALSLLSILVLAMLPVLGSTSRQLVELEELRLQNQFLRNLITCVNKKAPIQTDTGSLRPVEDLEDGDTRMIRYRDTDYEIHATTDHNGLHWYEIRREGMQDAIRLLRTE